MLQVTNLRQFQYSVAAAKARLSGTVTKKYQQFVTKVFTDLVSIRPSGQATLQRTGMSISRMTRRPQLCLKTSEYSGQSIQMGDPEGGQFCAGAGLRAKSPRSDGTQVSFVNPWITRRK